MTVETIRDANETAGEVGPGAIAVVAGAAGAGILAPAAALPILAAVGFTVGVPIAPAHAWLALAVGVLVTTVALRDTRLPPVVRGALGAAIPLLAWGGACALAGRFMDTSWDGNAYHAPAIVDLVRGWNPFRDAHDPFRTEKYAMWMDHYPKASWEVAAALHRLGLPFQASKGMNLALGVASFLYVLAAARARAGLRPLLSVLVALAAAANPVTVAQLFTFYLDGQVASALTILVAALTLLGVPRLRLVAGAGALGATAYLVNLKFTGVVYAALAAGAYLAISAVTGRSRGSLRWTAALAAAGAVAVAGVGYQPYVTNLRDHGHPFFPVFGSSDVVVMGDNVPPELRGKDRFTALALSTFSETGMWELHPKAPFRVSPAERELLGLPDVRIGGFGPLFGGILLAALAAAALLLLRAPSVRRDRAWLLLAAIFVTVLANPEAWWARYVPQLWLVPIGVAAVAARAGRGVIAAGLLGIVLWSSEMSVVAQDEARTRGTAALRAHLDEVAGRVQPVDVYFGPFEGFEPAFLERGIAYRRLASAPACADAVGFGGFPQYVVCARPR